MKDELVLSPLRHTWILDLDGSIVRHNGYKLDGRDSFLPGAKEFLENIPADDMIIFLTSRTEKYRDMTISFLEGNGIKFNQIIFGAPYGERILWNDRKPSGLRMSVAINTERDIFSDLNIIIDRNL